MSTVSCEAHLGKYIFVSKQHAEIHHKLFCPDAKYRIYPCPSGLKHWHSADIPKRNAAKRKRHRANVKARRENQG